MPRSACSSCSSCSSRNLLAGLPALRFALATGVLCLAPLPAQPQAFIPTERLAISPVDALSLEDLDRALDQVWARPTPPPLSDPSASRRAALRKAVEGWGPVSLLFPAPQPNATPPPESRFFQELLPNKIGFLRLGRISEHTSASLQSALKDFQQIGVKGIVLDLRASDFSGTLTQAADLASLFLSQDTPLFQIRSLHGNASTSAPRGQHSPVWPSAPHPPIAVLIGPETEGASEVFAATLQTHARALLIGQPTAGAGAQYREISLSEGRLFRFPESEAVFESTRGPFPKGLPPDLAIPLPAQTTRHLLRQQAQAPQLSPSLTVTFRPRVNEAALMAHKNPETEAWLQTQLKKSEPFSPNRPAFGDEALLRALDFVEVQTTLQPNAPTP